MTAGHSISTSQKISLLIKELAQEVARLSQTVNEPRGPQSDLAKNLESQLEVAAKVRGRALYYPYIGTGAGRGPYVELEDGSVKLDLINGIGIHLFGHSHPRLLEAAIRGSLSDIVNQGNLQPNKEYIKLAQRLVQLASKKSRLRHVWITTSGSRANENALKISRQKKSPARMVLAMDRAFAGRTTMMAEITDNPEYREGLPNYNEVLRVPFYDSKNPRSAEDSLRILKEHVARHEGNISAFMFEPVQGEGGFRVGPREYFIPMLEFCKQKGIAIWLDEVQTFGRTGELFAFEALDLGKYVDLVTVAKILQVGATLYTEEYNPKPGLIAGTFAGTSAALSVGLEILDMLENDGYFGADGKVAKIHNSVVSMLNELNETTCKGLLRDAGGLGLMVAVTPLDGSKDKVNNLLKIMFKNGIVAFSCGRDPYRMRFLLPAVLTDADIKVAKGIIEKSVLEAAKG
ncbi:MAG TPA: aminotransferase class III-fold pyridoxal phosphate-dependent enzyme [Bdellovibrionales bacterium]|nr:aminotransferase class III-fold pyridoxal phosphate-dependent enzyme [Bdellovibrionales bacterium]